MDHVAVRKDSLASLVRATAMNASRYIQQQKEANFRPYVNRKVKRKFQKTSKKTSKKIPKNSKKIKKKSKKSKKILNHIISIFKRLQKSLS